MAVFVVNGKPVTAEKNQKLIRFLRDELHLTSVKDGCSEGACGTCHGAHRRQAHQGLHPADGQAGGQDHHHGGGPFRLGKGGLHLRLRRGGGRAVRLLHPRHGDLAPRRSWITNPDPTREEAAFAIRNNICRCTGYVKIIDGILLAAKMLPRGQVSLRRARTIIRSASASTVSTSPEKVQGYGKYPDDVYVDGMCYGWRGAQRISACPRALHPTRKEAAELPGVVCVLTATDHPRPATRSATFRRISQRSSARGQSDAVSRRRGGARLCAETRRRSSRRRSSYRSFMKSCPAVFSPEEACSPRRAGGHHEATAATCRRTAMSPAAMPRKPSKIPNTSSARTISDAVDGARFFGARVLRGVSRLENGGVKLLTTDQSVSHHPARVRG